MEITTIISDRIKDYSREHGFAKTISWIVAKSLKRVWRFIYLGMDYNLAVYSFNDGRQPESLNNSDVLCREMTYEDIAKIREKFGDSIADTFSERLNNSTGYIAFCGEQVAGYSWSSSGLLRDEGIEPFLITMQPHEGNIYLYDAYTLPELRNMKVFSKIMIYMLIRSKELGFKHAYFTFRKDNHPVRAFLVKHGFSVEGEIKCRKYLFITSIKNDAFSKVCTVIS